MNCGMFLIGFHFKEKGLTWLFTDLGGPLT